MLCHPAAECLTGGGGGGVDALVKPVPFLLFVDNADVLVELKESIAHGGKAINFIRSWASPECFTSTKLGNHRCLSKFYLMNLQCRSKQFLKNQLFDNACKFPY